MRRSYPTEFVFQLAALFVAVIAVHAVYVTTVRPRADVVLAERAAAIQSDPDYVEERSVWVIIRD
ncbi:MAG: MotA/TolQ/ExbB proton channel family protein, partial [Acidobacteriota bacterium]